MAADLAPISAGKLDRLISIETLVVTTDLDGGQLQTWTALANVWAEVVPLSGREQMMAAQFLPEATTRFRIRYRTDVTETSRIVYEGKIYDIGYIAEIGRRDGLELLGKRP